MDSSTLGITYYQVSFINYCSFRLRRSKPRMVSVVQVYEKPVLNNPVLIEGLPGIGFVANIASLHLIQEL